MLQSSRWNGLSSEDKRWNSREKKKEIPITGLPTISSNTTIQDLMTGPHISDGGPKGQRIWDFSKDLPSTGILQNRGNIIPFPKGRRTTPAVKAMMQKGDIQVGTAPKTTEGILKAKKDRHILMRDADEDISRIKRENKSAIERFKQKFGKNEPKTVEDFRDKGDWDPGGMAYGGIAPLVGEPSYSADFYDDRMPMAGGSIVKGGRWFIKNLEIALKDLDSGKWKNLDPMQKEAFRWELKGLIGRIKMGEPLPEDMIKTIRDDPKFAEISKTRSTDPDLYEFEDVILNYGKKGDVVNEQVKILEKFDPKERLPNQSGGPVDHEALVQMYLAEGLSYEEAVQAAQSAANLPWDTLKKAEGGRAEFIFGGSAGLRAMWKQMMKGISERRGGKPIKRLFPVLSARDKAMEKVVIGTPEQKAFRAREKELKVEGIDLIINRLKHDKKILERQAKNKKMADPGLDFLMKKLEKQMSDVYTPHLKKYTDIDKDILDMETIKKNMIMKDRKLNAEGGRVSYSGGGRAGLPAITYGMSQPEMQGPQMPVSAPQPTGISGANLQMNQMDLMQQKMQQNPWMQNQMQQGMGGMQQPKYGGQLRIPFGLGGINKGRRAFMKWLAGLTGAGIAGASGLLKLGKTAPKVIPKAAEVIARDADGIPTYAFDLIEVVKAKGSKEIMEGLYKRNPPSTKYTYKDVEVMEDGLGNVSVKKPQTKTGSWTDEATDDTIVDDYVDREVGFEIRKGGTGVKDEGLETQKSFEMPDEYDESTAIMQGDPDGGTDVSEVLEYIDEADHLDLKKIADEIIDIRPKKASGGLAYALGE